MLLLGLNESEFQIDVTSVSILFPYSLLLDILQYFRQSDAAEVYSWKK